MPVADDDWRLRGQERYLKGAVLMWREWSPPPASGAPLWWMGDRTEWESPAPGELPGDAVESVERGWDHDHCDFCWGTFTAPGLDTADRGSLTAGYTMTSSRRSSPWICPRCFEDFRERFGWTVRSARTD